MRVYFILSFITLGIGLLILVMSLLTKDITLISLANLYLIFWVGSEVLDSRQRQSIIKPED